MTHRFGHGICNKYAMLPSSLAFVVHLCLLHLHLPLHPTKCPNLREDSVELGSPRVDYVFWMDCDSLFMNFARRLEDFIPKVGTHVSPMAEIVANELDKAHR